VAASAAPNGGETWRKAGPLPPAAPPSRPESPAPSARVSAVAPSGGWRAREEARRQATAGGAAPPLAAAASPAQAAPHMPLKKEDTAKDEDGFQTVSEKKGVWRGGSRRGRA
jgi:translation initiation factor 3 subunit A